MTDAAIAIYYTGPDQKERTEHLARSLELPIITDKTGYNFVLHWEKNRLNLSMPHNPIVKGPVYAEFVEGAAGYRRKQGSSEMLIKAIGCRKAGPLSVLDATGGLGRDSFLMAENGCSVYIMERNRVVAALLADGLRRARKHPDTVQSAARIQLKIMDSLELLSNPAGTEQKYDVVYLDPMYPQRTKSALVKKEMQLLQQLIGHEDDIQLLFTRALTAARLRVVVKRPKKVPPLAGETLSHSLTGRTTRFDVYMIKQTAA